MAAHQPPLNSATSKNKAKSTSKAAVRPGETTQSVKVSAHKHGDLSPSPEATFKKLNVWQVLVITVLG